MIGQAALSSKNTNTSRRLCAKMTEGRGAAVVVRTEWIKWWDALDMLRQHEGIEKGLQMARECEHPDAQWLAALFPAEMAVTEQRMREVLQEQGEDPRAIYLVWSLGGSKNLLRRAAEMDCAPAMSRYSDGSKTFKRLEDAAKLGDRVGVHRLGRCYERGLGFAQDNKKALQLYRESAELGFAGAQRRYGSFAFGELDWSDISGGGGRRCVDSLTRCALLF
jgi:TPR repeat protein